jgi:hypothetical protein
LNKGPVSKKKVAPDAALKKHRSTSVVNSYRPLK